MFDAETCRQAAQNALRLLGFNIPDTAIAVNITSGRDSSLIIKDEATLTVTEGGYTYSASLMWDAEKEAPNPAMIGHLLAQRVARQIGAARNAIITLILVLRERGMSLSEFLQLPPEVRAQHLQSLSLSLESDCLPGVETSFRVYDVRISEAGWVEAVLRPAHGRGERLVAANPPESWRRGK